MSINLLCIPLTIATQKGVLYLFYIQFWQILSTDIFRGHGKPFDYGKESIKIRKSNEVAGTAFFYIRGKTGHFLHLLNLYGGRYSDMNIIKSVQ